jgi:polyisoprenoid-binding protein YceI
MRLQMMVVATALACSTTMTDTVRAADTYDLDGSHTDVGFRVSHLGISWAAGRFDDVRGGFTIDAVQPSNTAFTMTINTSSIDTNNTKRDDHLRSPDFFNAKQFPVIMFKSTQVQPIQGGYAVTGDFTMHGVTKPITINLMGGGAKEFPPGVQRTGFSGDLKLKRSDFGMDKYGEAVGDDVFVTISFEGTKK